MDRAIDAIEYAVPDEIVEVYQSLNRTRVSMDDRTTVTCDAYLCGLRRNGVPRVYIALNLIDSKGVLVYSPEKQPQNEDEFAAIMHGGMEFIEIVGFMMDRIDLGKDADKKEQVLNRVPVLRRVS
jgi:hypothetical protein